MRSPFHLVTQKMNAAGRFVLGCALLLVPLVGRADEKSAVKNTPAAAALQNGPAYVITKVALARSGPGMDHYATDALAMGDMVEIVAQQDGWAAIRPPLGAYSWVAADKLQVLNEREAEVVADTTKAWVGSDIESVRKHASQVQLRRGERVEVIGQKDVKSSDSGKAVWAKIRPPVGERRWVRLTELGDAPPLQQARSRPSSHSSPPPNEDGWTDRRQKPASLGVLANALPEERARHNESRSSFINARKRLADFENEMARLQVAITRAAAAAADREELAELQREIEDLVDAGRTPLERGQASRLLESADELLELAEQREELGVEDTQAVDADSKESGKKRELAHFQVKGRLMPMVWFGRPTELCAIMEDEHTLVAFVTPAPGVNLRRYLNKEVGIMGEDSFAIRGKRHVVVHRVVDLSRHRDGKSDTFADVPWIKMRPKQREAAVGSTASAE